MEIISIGDQLAEGTYRVHSRFADVVNFVGNESLVSVASEKIGPGPVNIVARGLDFREIEAVQIGGGRLRLDQLEFPIREVACFSSGIDMVGEIDIKKLISNLKTLKNTLIDLSPPKCLAFLIDPKRQAEFKTSFDKKYAGRMEEGVREIFDGVPANGIQMIRGLGYGLTPSGDDFIAGMLLAYNIADRIFNVDYSEFISEAYKDAKGENHISNSGLFCAKNGWMTEKQKALVTALFYSHNDDVAKYAGIAIKAGETSGADWCVGLFLTMNRIFDYEREFDN